MTYLDEIREVISDRPGDDATPRLPAKSIPVGTDDVVALYTNDETEAVMVISGSQILDLIRFANSQSKGTP